MPKTLSPFSRPFYMMAKPVGAACNLACGYCYYKGGHPDEERETGSTGRVMSDEVLERFIQQYLESQVNQEVLFTWHGGEPTILPISFFEKAMQLQQRYARGRQIDNCLQTNGTLLTDEWCEFLRENRFLVGISIDGPQTYHDAYRCRSFDKVMRGIRLLQKHSVEWNAMATVNHLNADDPVGFYRFFKEIGCQFLQFTPVVERVESQVESGGQVRDISVTPEQWGRFLCGVYDEWKQKDIGQIFVQLFDATLANWAGEPPGICSMSPTCGRAAVMEANGDVYSCDHFVFPEYRLGNIRQQSLTEMLYGERQQQFGRNKRAGLPRQCRECRFLFACHGECPKNRFLKDKYGEPGLNYLCAGYQQFFAHVATDMDFMKAELDAGRSPANLMNSR